MTHSSVNIMKIWIALTFAALSINAAGFAFAAGSPELEGHQKKLRLTKEPEKVQQVLDVQKTLAALRSKPGAAGETHDVVIRGQIGGMPNIWPEMHPNFPWYEKQASFFVVDSKIAAQFAAHSKQHGGSHNCAFCQSLAERNANAIAVVNMVDERGEIIPIDSRELLGLKEKQTVVIRGKAKLLGGSMLVIDADGIYTRR